MLRIVAVLAAKDIVLLLRDRGSLFFVLVLPIVLAVLYGFMFSAGPHGIRPLPIAVVGDGPAADALATALAGSPALAIMRQPRAEAEAEVRRGARIAAVLVEAAGLRLLVDPARRAEIAVLEGVLAGSAGGAPRRPEIVPIGAGGNAGAAHPASAFMISFPAGMVWGLIACAATFAVGLARERVAGTLLRLRQAPVPHGTILAGKALACMTVCVAAVGVLAATGLAFGVHPQSPTMLAAAAVAVAWAFAGLMTLLGQSATTERAVNGAAWGVLLLLALFGGAMAPLYLMPDWMAAASDASPVRWAILALEGAIWRGLSWREMALPLGVLLGTGSAAFAAGALLSRRLD